MNRSYLYVLRKIQVKVKASVVSLQGSLPFPSLHFCSLSFLPLIPTPRILAQMEQVSVTLTGNSLLSPIFPQSWALQIVTITGQ